MGPFFEERRRWFDEHVSRPTCPCCGYPTLDHRADWDICALCQWEDDGQDDPDADEGGGGPNSCSLSQARRHFEAHLSMYDREETRSRREDTPALLEAKKALIAAFEGLRTILDPKQIASQWKAIREIEDAVFKARHGSP